MSWLIFHTQSACEQNKSAWYKSVLPPPSQWPDTHQLEMCPFLTLSPVTLFAPVLVTCVQILSKCVLGLWGFARFTFQDSPQDYNSPRYLTGGQYLARGVEILYPLQDYNTSAFCKQYSCPPKPIVWGEKCRLQNNDFPQNDERRGVRNWGESLSHVT